MTDREDGGPAFPHDKYKKDGSHGWGTYAHGGMSLRDWFAGQVLASAAALPLGPSDCRHRAKVAYEQADAMLAARKATGAA